VRKAFQQIDLRQNAEHSTFFAPNAIREKRQESLEEGDWRADRKDM
jgi:hypothetical protein